MDHMNEYRSKLRTPDEAVRIVRSGDWIDYSTNLGFPIATMTTSASRV